jgi:hypothetical protein
VDDCEDGMYVLVCKDGLIVGAVKVGERDFVDIVG